MTDHGSLLSPPPLPRFYLVFSLFIISEVEREKAKEFAHDETIAAAEGETDKKVGMKAKLIGKYITIIITERLIAIEYCSQRKLSGL